MSDKALNKIILLFREGRSFSAILAGLSNDSSSNEYSRIFLSNSIQMGDRISPVYL